MKPLRWPPGLPRGANGAGQDTRAVLSGIQALRAVAALMVAVTHSSIRAGEPIAVGNAGVDLFFVISGFIVWIVSSRARSPGSFAWARIRRIVPLYWIATAIMLSGGLAGAFPKLVLDPFHVAASFAFLPYPSPMGGTLSPLLVQGWTLNYEMFFYLIFGLTLFAPSSWRVFILSGVISVLAGLGWAGNGTGFASFYTDPLLLEFLAGVLIGFGWQAGWLPARSISVFLGLLGAALLTAQAVWHLEFARVVAWGIPAALLVLGVAGIEKSGLRLHCRPLHILGDASYSIYLFHLFGISVAARLLGEQLSFWPETIISTVFAALVGVAVYFLVEKPIDVFLKEKTLNVTQGRAAARR